jgi:hypothetical protein
MEIIAVLKNKLSSGLAFLVMMFMSVMVFAQADSGTVKVKDVITTKTTTTEWYTNPLYLILGAILVLVIILLLVRSGNKNRN